MSSMQLCQTDLLSLTCDLCILHGVQDHSSCTKDPCQHIHGGAIIEASAIAKAATMTTHLTAPQRGVEASALLKLSLSPIVKPGSLPKTHNYGDLDPA